MNSRFLKQMNKIGVSKKTNILLAVSGGIDSMVLFDLLLKNNFSFLGNNRGKGLMIGTEFTDSNGNPGTEIASEVQKGCIDKGLLVLTCGTYLNIIRWIPPLIVSKKEIDKVLEIFSSVVTKYKKEKY